MQYIAIQYTSIMSSRKQAAALLEPPAAYTSANEQMLTSAILEPVMQWYGIDQFQHEVTNTQNQISQGILRNIREVEVALTAAAKVRPHNHEL